MFAAIIMENIPCDYCGSDNPELKWRAPDRLTNTGEVFSVVKCRQCGLIYVNPRPSLGEMTKYYPADYWAFIRLKGIKWRIKKRILDRELSAIKKRLPAGAKILEIGTGSGEDLAYLRDIGGYIVEGSDVSEHAVNTGKKEFNLDLKQGAIEDLNYPEGFYDLVRLKFVISHVAGPMRFLKEVNRVLKSQGWVLMWVPNFESWSQKIFKSRWLGGEPPRHLYDFSGQTISNYLEKTGFEIIELRHSVSPNTFIHSFRYWLSEHNLPNFAVRLFSINFFSMILFLPFSLLASLTRASDRLMIIARKTT